jgi:hypothetical protein
MVWFVSLSTLVLLAWALGAAFDRGAEPLRWARVWGGPTEGPAPLNLRVELVNADPAEHHALSGPALIRLESRAGTLAQLALRFDDQNTSYVSLALDAPNPFVTILLGRDTLAAGTLQLSRSEYWQRRRSRGGWVHRWQQGNLRVAAGCREGVFTLGKPGTLAIAVSDAAGNPIATELTLELEGLDAAPPGLSVALRSDEQGHATLAVTPIDLSAALRIGIGSRNAPAASFYSSLPVEPNATIGLYQGGRVIIDSLISTAKSYYALINEQGCWSAGAIDMNCDERSHCHGERTIAVTPTLPAWLMVGNEPGFTGPNVIGWPIAPRGTEFVSEAIAVSDQLLLDGKTMAIAAAARQKSVRFVWILSGLVFAAVALLAAVAVQLVHSQREFAEFKAELPEGVSETVFERRPYWMMVLVAIVVLGLVALAAWSRSRIFGD